MEFEEGYSGCSREQRQANLEEGCSGCSREQKQAEGGSFWCKPELAQLDFEGGCSCCNHSEGRCPGCDAQGVTGNRTRGRGEARRVAGNRRRLTLRGHPRSISRKRRVGWRRRRCRCRHRSWCRYMAMLAGRVCHALTQIKPLTADVDVRLVLEGLPAYKRLHDMAVGAEVVVGTVETPQWGAVEWDGLLAAVAVVDET